MNIQEITRNLLLVGGLALAPQPVQSEKQLPDVSDVQGLPETINHGLYLPIVFFDYATPVIPPVEPTTAPPVEPTSAPTQ